MSEVGTFSYKYSQIHHPNSVPQGGGSTETLNLEAHTSTNMKVKRPKVMPNDVSIVPSGKMPFSDREATKKIQAINTDIYEGAKQEKEKHAFNFKRYFTIFGIIGLLTAAFAYIRKGKRR